MRKQNKNNTTDQNETTNQGEQTRDARGCGSKRKGSMMQKPRHKGSAGGKRSRRPLAHGDLNLLILSLIQETPRHGYDLITQIETRTSGAYKPSPGVMYPALEVLQDMGLAEVALSGAKKIFHITKDGTATLTAKADDLAKISGQLEKLASPKETDDIPTVRAAAQRLQHAVKSHIRGDDISDTERETIVAFLNEARQKIETLRERKTTD